MKHTTVFLILSVATVGIALAQGASSEVATASVSFRCPEDECHVLPWFRGEGGFIGEIRSGFEEVTYNAVCGDMSVSQSLRPDGSGIVATLFGTGTDLACERDDGELEIYGMADGGWYWITDEENTAVSFLMSKAILQNSKIAPANPGLPGLTFTASRDRSVSFVRDVATGHVGLLPHILPLPGEPEPPRCGQYKECEGEDCEDEDRVTKQRTDDCLLDAVYSVRVTMGPGTGPDSAIASGQVFRPASGTTPLALGLYGTGHLDIVDPLGAGFDESLAASWTVTARTESAPGPPTTIGSDRILGISADLSNGVLTVHNSADSDETCTQEARHMVTLEIKATAGINDVLPPVPGETRDDDLRPTGILRVRCPGAPAALGQELVPEGNFSGEKERGGA